MTRIKIKSRNNGREQKIKLLQILSSKQIEVTDIIPTNDGFAVITVNEQFADNIFNNEVKQELLSHDLTPLMPPQLKANKSIIITRTPELIYEKDILSIGEELTSKNYWIEEDDIESVYKFPNSTTIKVTFNKTCTAKKMYRTRT